MSGVRNKGVEVRVLTNPLGLSLQGSMVLIRMRLYHYRNLAGWGQRDGSGLKAFVAKPDKLRLILGVTR